MMSAIELVIERLGSHGREPRQNGSGWKANCPVCDDRNGHLGIKEVEAGKVILNCLRGCNPAEITRAIGLSLASLFPARERSAHAFSSPIEQLALMRGWRASALMTLGARADGEYVAFPMRNAAGEKTGEKLRRGDGRPIKTKDGESKSWTRKDSKNGLIYPDSFPTNGEDVLVAEGEADVCAAISAGWKTVVGTPGCTPGRTVLAELQKLVSGRKCVLVPDPEESGRLWLKAVGVALLNAGCTVRFVPAIDKDLDERLRGQSDKAASLKELLLGAIPYQACVEKGRPRNGSESEATPKIQDSRPEVQLPGDDSLYLPCINALIAHAAKMSIYMLNDLIVTPRDRKLIAFSAVSAQTEFEKVVRFYVHRNRSGKPCKIAKPLSREHSTAILESLVFQQALPRIERIAMAPLPYIHEGQLQFTQPGYDPISKTYTFFEGATPEPYPIEKCLSVLTGAVQDFCFDEDVSTNTANTLGAMITLITRLLYRGETPAFSVEGNQQGIGKGALVKLICIPALGAEPNAYAWPDEEGEMRKRVMAVAMNGSPIYWLDDLSGHLKSPVLNMVLTSRFIEDRILGSTKTVSLQWNAATFLTGNCYTIERDLARRVVPIHLRFNGEDIDSRHYQHPDLINWAIEERNHLLSAMYGLIKNWADKGFLKASIPFASYGDWAATIGGIMQAAGISDFLKNRSKIAAQADSETMQIAELFKFWHEHKGCLPLSAQEILPIMRAKELFPFIGEKEDRCAVSSLGRLLQRYDRRQFGGLQLVKLPGRPPKYKVVPL